MPNKEWKSQGDHYIVEDPSYASLCIGKLFFLLRTIRLPHSSPFFSFLSTVFLFSPLLISPFRYPRKLPQNTSSQSLTRNNPLQSHPDEQREQTLLLFAYLERVCMGMIIICSGLFIGKGVLYTAMPLFSFAIALVIIQVSFFIFSLSFLSLPSLTAQLFVLESCPVHSHAPLFLAFAVSSHIALISPPPYPPIYNPLFFSYLFFFLI